MGSWVVRIRALGARPIVGLVATAAVVASLFVFAVSASAEEAKPVAKVAPGVYVSKISAEATSAARVRRNSEPGRVLAAKQSAGRSPRIIGGTPTTIAEWPWQTATLYDPSLVPGDGFQRQFCAGSLVAPNAVISAAHCAFDVIDTDGGFDPVFFNVVTGRTVLSSSQGQELPVARYFAFTDAAGNPLFDGDPSHGWDVILIRLASPSASPTINLAGPNERAAWAPGRTAFATGWGALNDAPPALQVFPDDLREVQLSIIADSTCGSPTAYDGLFVPARGMLCAGDLAGGRDVCQADSGGPLVVPIGGAEFRLVGDTSFGEGCGRPNKPGVYGRIAADPMLHGLADIVLRISGVSIIGTCQKDVEALLKAKKKFKKARKKLEKTGTKNAEKKFKKAKKKQRKAKKAASAAC